MLLSRINKKNSMKVLVIGSGAREHAIVWKLSQSEKVSEIFAAPGNAGINSLAQGVNISVENIDSLLEFALNQQIDLTVVGPELPLVLGITNKFQEHGLKVFGPNAKAAQLEGSKSFSKEFMQRYRIPTASYEVFTRYDDFKNNISKFQFPLVIKADGLAAGKGVIICNAASEALNAAREILDNKRFGEAGNQIVVEEFLEGIEASLLCFVAHNRLIPMQSAKDYKRAFDNDEGPNTGGMGCISPNPLFTKDLEEKIQNNILSKIEAGLNAEGIDFYGILFIGLMITRQESKVLEFNVRFGDPETEVLLPRLESDLLDVMLKTIDNTLQISDLRWASKKCITVVAASGGYPEDYKKGLIINGLDTESEFVTIFHAGTKLVENQIVTNGGRVLAITALDESMGKARSFVYQQLKSISFDGMFYRNDIGKI